MSYSFDHFCADVRDALVEDPGVEGRERVRKHLERFLADSDSAKGFRDADWPRGTTKLHHDTETGIYIWGHSHTKDGGRGPHDHGATWAIYSTLSGRADMAEWRRMDDGNKPGHAEIVVEKTYSMGPGTAALYNERVIHSARYPAGTRLIRITGRDLDQETVRRFDPDGMRVIEHNRARASSGK